MTRGPIPVLDHGDITLIDTMGDDSAIVQAARVSYGPGTKTLSDDRKLIRYLMRHRHTTPFEMVEVKLRVKCPIFVARQWMRHRTGSVNEMSARYSEMPDEMYVPKPEHIGEASKSNKQARALDTVTGAHQWASGAIDAANRAAYETYRDMLDEGVPREVARGVLGGNLYTAFYWKVDLHNLMHFLRLRNAPDAQWEIQQYAKVIEDEILPGIVPVAMEAFRDYERGEMK